MAVKLVIDLLGALPWVLDVSAHNGFDPTIFATNEL